MGLITERTWEGEAHVGAALFVRNFLRLRMSMVRIEWVDGDEVHLFPVNNVLPMNDAMALFEVMGKSRADECDLKDNHLRLWWD